MPSSTLRALPLVGALWLAGCAPAPSAAPPSQVATIGTTIDLAGVNELVSGGVRFTNELLDLLFPNLLAEQPDWQEHPPTLAPDLARSYELSEDRRSLTFHLRSDARWSDGTPVTAEDVRFSWVAQCSPAVVWRYADSKEAIEEVEVLDATTVRFRFRSPYPFQIVDANDGKVLPAHAWRELPFERWRTEGDWFRAHLVTSGPFRLASWTTGRELVLERATEPSDRYAITRAVFQVVPDPAALVERLLAGELDFVDGLTPRDAERIRGAPGLRLIATPSRQFDAIGWNSRRAPFDDPEVRRALTLGIDREALVDTLWREAAEVAAGPVPPGVWARDPELRPWPYDPAEARAILARRGFRDTDGDGVVERDGRPFRFELTTNAGNRARADAAALVRDNLLRIGVEAELRTLELRALIDRNDAGDFDATILGWAIDTTLDLRPYFHSSAIGSAGQNFVAYRNPEVDRLLDAARSQPDLAGARPMLIEVQRALHREQPYTFLWTPRRLSAAAADLGGVEVTHLSALRSLPHWTRRPAGS